MSVSGLPVTVVGSGGLPVTIVSPGTTTNDNAVAGDIGEYQENSTGLAGVTSLAGNNLAQLTLTPGDWDVTGTVVGAASNASTNVQGLVGSLSIVSTTHSFNTGDFASVQYGPGIVTGNNAAIAAVLPVKRFSVPAASTVIVFLVGSLTFTVSTGAMKGFMRARRVR